MLGPGLKRGAVARPLQELLQELLRWKLKAPVFMVLSSNSSSDPGTNIQFADFREHRKGPSCATTWAFFFLRMVVCAFRLLAGLNWFGGVVSLVPEGCSSDMALFTLCSRGQGLGPVGDQMPRSIR